MQELRLEMIRSTKRATQKTHTKAFFWNTSPHTNGFTYAQVKVPIVYLDKSYKFASRASSIPVTIGEGVLLFSDLRRTF